MSSSKHRVGLKGETIANIKKGSTYGLKENQNYVAF